MQVDKEIEKQYIKFIDSHKKEMIDLWRAIVRIESPSYFKEGVDKVGAVISDFCREKLNYYVRFQDSEVYGNCLAACSCPFEEFKNGIVLSAHMDTVFEVGFFDPVIEEDEEFIFGPGAGDCKGGIIMSLLVAWALKDCGYNKRPIKLVFAADEESGGPTGSVFYPLELKNASSESLGFGEFKPVFVGGASDASYASEMGIPVICATGPIVDYQHTRQERVVRASMAERAKIHVKTILSLPN